MGVDFAIDIESRQPQATGISEEEIAAYYRAHTPSGEPPLAVIREHVIRAIAVERATSQLDPIDALQRRFVDDFGRFRIWHDPELESLARARGVTPLSAFQRERGGEVFVDGKAFVLDASPNPWCDPADGLRTVRALQAELAARGADFARALECLALVEQILSVAEREQRRWRLLAMW